MNEAGLAHTVEQLANTMQALSDADLDRDWVWRYHAEGVRFALLGTYHELRDLAVALVTGRAEAGHPVTAAQHALGQYHAAFRDLQAVLLGVKEADFERPPAQDEWTLRQIVEHIIQADTLFFTLVHHARRQQQAGIEPSRIKAEDWTALIGTEESLATLLETAAPTVILDFYETHHGRVLRELADLTDAELEAPSLYWEGESLPIRWRLHRFDAHLRQHTVQVVKTMDALGLERNEAKRLLRTLYNALAEVEAVLIGAWNFNLEAQRELAATIETRTLEIASVITKAA
ncbi:MAG: DinB family protein [Candidatus Promineifilaceae bacterium]|nr:DinB family protein [Candidatus Promineifilaceae bacterium]